MMYPKVSSKVTNNVSGRIFEMLHGFTSTLGDERFRRYFV